MSKYDVEKLRNVGIISHRGAGKTSLAEALLYQAKMTTRLGVVEDGTSILDYTEDEIKRKMTLNSSLTHCLWKENKVNLLDTPGYADLVGEVIGALRVVDAALVVLCAASGVEVGSEKTWKHADDRNLPRIIFINKMNRERADFYKTLDQAKEILGLRIVPLTLPLGSESNFKGIVDLLKMKAYTYSSATNGEAKEEDIPADLTEQAGVYRQEIIEAAAESNDELLEKYFAEEKLSDEEVKAGLRAATLEGTVVPVFCGSATGNIGSEILLDGMIDYLPSPLDRGEVKGIDPKSDSEVVRKPSVDEPLSALVFKTMADPYAGKLNFFRVYSGVFSADSQTFNANEDNKERVGHVLAMKGKDHEDVEGVSTGDIGVAVKLQNTTTSDTLCDEANPIRLEAIEFPEPVFAVALRPKTKGDEDKLSTAISRLLEEDPTFTSHRDQDTGELLLTGMGETHLEVIVAKLGSKFGVEVESSPPKVPYKETIRAKAKKQGKHKKQTGGHGQYGDAVLEIEPLERGKGFEFVDKIVGGVIPKQYIPGVEKGVVDAMVKGIVAGYPVVDIRVTLTFGSYHPVDSSEMAFRIAGSMAFKEAMAEAKPGLLEPIMKAEVTAPSDNTGDIMGDLNSHRGRILGVEPQENGQDKINVLMPLAELSTYSANLRSITQGRGSYRMEFSHYEDVPDRIAQDVITAAEKEKEGG